MIFAIRELADDDAEAEMSLNSMIKSLLKILIATAVVISTVACAESKRLSYDNSGADPSFALPGTMIGTWRLYSRSYQQLGDLVLEGRQVELGGVVRAWGIGSSKGLTQHTIWNRWKLLCVNLNRVRAIRS